jgi:hypothetical protein
MIFLTLSAAATAPGRGFVLCVPYINVEGRDNIVFAVPFVVIITVSCMFPFHLTPSFIATMSLTPPMDLTLIYIYTTTAYRRFLTCVQQFGV